MFKRERERKKMKWRRIDKKEIEIENILKSVRKGKESV